MKYNSNGAIDDTHKDRDSCDCARSYLGNPPKLSICFWCVRFLALVIKGAWAKKNWSEHLEMYQWDFGQVIIAAPTNARCLHLNIFLIFFFPSSKSIGATLVTLSSPGNKRADLNAWCVRRSFIEISWCFARLGNIFGAVSCLSVWIIERRIWLRVETNWFNPIMSDPELRLKWWQPYSPYLERSRIPAFCHVSSLVLPQTILRWLPSL